MAEIQGGTGAETITDLPRSLAEIEAEDDFENKPVTKPAEEVKPPAEETKPTETGTSTEEEEKPKEEAPKEEEGQEENTEEEVTPEAFYEQVNKLHGFDNFKVEYPDGVDPLSAEGLHIREKALIERAQEDFDNYLKQTDPRAYAYMLHRQAGGTDEDFYANKTVTLPAYDTFKDNVDLQRQFVTRDLLNKGVDEDVAQAQVEKLVKEGKLFDKADALYKTTETNEQKALAAAEKAATDRQKAEAAAVQSTVDAITDVVMNSKVNNIVIPDAKRAAFAEHIKQHLYFDGENFFLNKPLTKESLADAIQAEYFGFVKGNLKELVERKANTQRAQALRLGAQRTKTGPKSGADATKNSGYIPLGDL